MKNKEINFTKNNGLIPAIIQDDKTRDVFMLGYMNEVALGKTKETGFVHFWSRSRNKLWMKGEESGNRLKVKDIFIDCDNDTILITAELLGMYVCHTGKRTCFNKKFYNEN
jgi:phosphoribosyl-AMP cyclohydrolase / phosphoribosyl-ATP pyrophosphohydrolase